jgi:peptidoglycan/LPS O-acetylase OafA/YrhL
MINPTPENVKIHSLEGMRGVMAWWVVIGHLAASLSFNVPILSRVDVPVDVFIILSGFVIARLIDRKNEGYRDYIIRRALRIFPLYFAVLIVSVMTLPIQSNVWHSFPAVAAIPKYFAQLADEGIANLPQHFLTHIILVQGLIPNSVLQDAPYTIVSQAWSVSLEWQFYLLAPFVIASLRRGQRSLLILLALVLFGLSIHHLFTSAFIGSKSLQFGIGIFSYLAIAKKTKSIRYIVGLGSCGIGSCIVHGYWQVIPLFIWAAVLISALSPNHIILRAPARLLGSAIMRRNGEISYSIYLVHMIPIYLGLFALGHDRVLALTASVLVGTLLLSLFTHRYIEKPGISLGSALTRPAA